MKKCIYILSLICISFSGFTQTTHNHSTDSIYSFQTMHVHFDKDVYLPGETIWFKAYLYNINEISFTSTNFYAALYDEQGKLILQKQYPILDGTCYGDFEIPYTVYGSRIQFMAFTKAMIHNDTNNIYQKVLTIYNKEHPSIIRSTPDSITLQFYPEGGQLVAEVDNQIAFKACFADGTPALIKGQIVEVERNKTLDSFFTNQLGLGKLTLAPSPHKTYKAIWKDEGGIVKETLLPDINRYGVSFHTAIIDKQLQYSIVKNKTCDSLNNLHVLAQIGNLQVYKANISIPTEMEVYAVQFPIDNIPAGLLQLSLFDNNWNLLQQKIMFINNADAANKISIQTDTLNLNAKGKNSIEIMLNDTSYTNLSVSIADIDFYNSSTHSITQDILLNTQLNQLTFSADTLLYAANNPIIDLITQTHSWKKFTWQNLSIKKDEQKTLDNYVSVSALFRQKNFAIPQTETLNMIVSKGGMGNQFYSLTPYNQTSFKKDNLIFFDSVKVAYQTDKNKELTNYITIQKDDTLTIPATIHPLSPIINFTKSNSSSKEKSFSFFSEQKTGKFNSIQTIKEVVVKSPRKGNPKLERIDELDKFYTSGMFSGTTKGFQLNVIDDTVGVATNHDLRDYLRYRLPGMTLKNGSFGVYRTKLFPGISPSGEAKNTIKTVFIPLLIFINEQNMTVGLPEDTMGGIKSSGGDPLELISMNDVAYIKYIPNIVIGGTFSTTEGALYVYTKNGNEKKPAVKGIPSVYIKGYTTQKEFSLSDYTDKHLRIQQDLRSTLYWNPNLQLDKDNTTYKINFYNNDISKKILLKIEGVNATGQLIYLEKIIEQ